MNFKRFFKIVLIIIGVVVLLFVILMIGVSVKNRKLTSLTYSLQTQNYRASDLGMAYGQEIGLGARENPVSSMLGGAVNSLVGYDKAVAPSLVVDSSQTKVDTVSRLIIKTGYFSVVVKDVTMATKAVVEFAEKNGGFVVSSNVYKSGLAPYAEVVVRIPAKEFDKGVQEVKAIGEVKSERVNGQDVTEEYVDLEAQLKNLRATENQFLSVLTRAEKITDILAVQRELKIVRGEIERMEGRIKYLRQSAEMSTLTVNLSTDPNVLPTLDETNKWKPLAVLKDAARSLLEVGKSLVNLLIWLVVFIPFWAVLGLVVWLVVKAYRRIRNVRI